MLTGASSCQHDVFACLHATVVLTSLILSTDTIGMSTGHAQQVLGCQAFCWPFLERVGLLIRKIEVELHNPYGPMDKAPAYGAGDSGFESQYGLDSFSSS